ncbi:MAG TPA: polysaccharide deacetylase family protein [Acidothermaceae bacterium]|nr:polysaccharide deacetylase family protein [Acidothermaceae bacterium]
MLKDSRFLPLGLAAVAAQVAPAATWLPSVRAAFPRLAGVGRSDHVAITFDDGPDPVSTPAILDLLRASRARATFFLVGERIARASDVVQRIIDEGHEIGLHGWRHRYTFTTSPRLARCLATLSEAVGPAHPRPRWFRPPYGVLSATSAVEAARNRLRPILWTTWAKDWRADATPESIATLMAPGIVGGATLLLHDASTNRAPMSWTATAGALPVILRECAARGLQVGPLCEHGVG